MTSPEFFPTVEDVLSLASLSFECLTKCISENSQPCRMTRILYEPTIDRDFCGYGSEFLTEAWTQARGKGGVCCNAEQSASKDFELCGAGEQIPHDQAVGFRV